jgi:hypothetical protein
MNKIIYILGIIFLAVLVKSIIDAAKIKNYMKGGIAYLKNVQEKKESRDSRRRSRPRRDGRGNSENEEERGRCSSDGELRVSYAGSAY